MVSLTTNKVNMGVVAELHEFLKEKGVTGITLDQAKVSLVMEKLKDLQI
jgi:hypothetical protein